MGGNYEKSVFNQLQEVMAKLDSMESEHTVMKEEITKLEKENHLLRDDNERMKREQNNDSSNSSLPPSKDKPWKAPNTFNIRKTTKMKQGAQPLTFLHKCVWLLREVCTSLCFRTLCH